jgi:DNA repair exonuclease SbcCD nuclease subunit
MQCHLAFKYATMANENIRAQKYEVIIMALYITGDTHGSFMDTAKLRGRPFSQVSKNLTKDDCVLIAGDFGWCFNATKSGGESNDERKTLDNLEKLTFTVLFIDGNHENFDRLYKYPEAEAFGGKVGVLRPHVLHLKQRGHIYDICNYKCWCFGGASSADKQFRREGTSWWPQEEPTQTEYEYGISQLEKAGWNVDIAITHDAPSWIARYLTGRMLSNPANNGWEDTPVTAYLQGVAAKINCKRWFFGHHHKDTILNAYGGPFGRSCETPLHFVSVYDKVLDSDCKEDVYGIKEFKDYFDFKVWDSTMAKDKPRWENIEN